MKQENVVLITIDCLRADHTGYMGYERDITPNIDELSENGVSFTQAISNGPSTNFSFPSILASSYFLSFPPKELVGSKRKIYMPSLLGGKTLAECLNEGGYYTAAVHSNAFLSSFYGYDRGFDTFIDLGEENTPTEGQDIFSKIRRRFELFKGKRPYGRNSAVTENGIACLRDIEEEGFFLWLHYMSPHWPYATRKYPLIDGGVISTLNRMFSLDTEIKLQKTLYDEEVRDADREIGRFFEAVKELGVSLENTYFIITADHGQEFAEHDRWGHINRPYEELLDVPLVISGPEIERGKTDSSLVELLDLAPTILELLNVEQPLAFEGEPFAFSENFEESKEGVISERSREDETNLSYQTERWKYILTFVEEEIEEELYDLRDDPGEKVNLAEEEEEKVNMFREKLSKHYKNVTTLRREKKKMEDLKKKIH